jgi:hypothetical protein
MRLKMMKEITQHFSDVNRCHTVHLNRAHAECRSETLRLDATFLVIGLCNTKWILYIYIYIYIYIYRAVVYSWGLFSVQLLDFVNTDMNFQIPKRKCNWRDFRLSLDVFDLISFYSALVVRIDWRFGTNRLS